MHDRMHDQSETMEPHSSHTIGKNVHGILWTCQPTQINAGATSEKVVAVEQIQKD